jgi:hypothetical protein
VLIHEHLPLHIRRGVPFLSSEAASKLVIPLSLSLSRDFRQALHFLPFPIDLRRNCASRCRTARERESVGERRRSQILRTFSSPAARRPPCRLPGAGHLHARTLPGRAPFAARRKGRRPDTSDAASVRERRYVRAAAATRWWRCTSSRCSGRCGRGSVPGVRRLLVRRGPRRGAHLRLPRAQPHHAWLPRRCVLGRRPPMFLFKVGTPTPSPVTSSCD